MVLAMVGERDNSGGEGVARIPLHGEAGSLGANNDGVVVRERARRDGVSTETRVHVSPNGVALLAVGASGAEVLGISTSKDVEAVTMARQRSVGIVA